jgi:hypothetical protein
MPRSHPEKRRFPRFQLDHALLVRVVTNGGSVMPARTLEISAGGCKLVNDIPMAVGTRVELVISAGDRPVLALGRVIYELPLRSARYQIGVEFLELSPADRDALAALLSEQTAYQST